ncbi:MAG: serine acetyltransferase [Clostridia bacterium]|nr:serine acetyltransferase [Clostridia bacterium]
MVKEILTGFIRPFIALFVFARYKTVWALKEKLRTSPKKHRLLESVYWSYFSKRGSYIGINARFATQPCFPHGVIGVFISDNAVIGRDAVIFQQVTIGSNQLPDSDGKGSPTLGDNVYIGAGAKLIGGITVGHRCRIGANAVVYKDLPDDSVAVCAATRVIQKKDLDNRYTTQVGSVTYRFSDGRMKKVDK